VKDEGGDGQVWGQVKWSAESFAAMGVGWQPRIARTTEMTYPIPFLTVETRCPGCGNSLVVKRNWIGDSLKCGQCGVVYRITGPAWQIPDSKDGEPVSSELREMLLKLSAISREPDKFSLTQELQACESLLRFLASEKGTPANLWAVCMWCAYSGDSTDYAPDALNDIYEDLGIVGIDTADEKVGTTPTQLLERLMHFKRNLEVGEPCAVREGQESGLFPRRGERVALREMMARFLTIGEAFAGHGPGHPDAPNNDSYTRIQVFLKRYPRLLRDSGYIEFLWNYCGASLHYPAEMEGAEQWVAWLPGLIQGDRHFIPFTEEGYGVDPDGFLMVAQLFHQVAKLELQFGYYVSGEDRPGLHLIAYRGPVQDSHRRDAARHWYCESFADWLGRFLDLQERIFEE
jgi:hypothetical protein